VYTSPGQKVRKNNNNSVCGSYWPLVGC